MRRGSSRDAFAGKRALAALAALALSFGAWALPNAAGAAPAEPTYYVAMGDSLASGFGVSASESYVHRVYERERRRMPGLQLKNFACARASTKSILNGPGCGAGSQLGRVKAFLRAHAGHIAFLTINVGINDVPGLANPAPATRIVVSTAAIRVRLTRILAELKAASPGLRGFGMNYYNPALAFWLDGPSGPAVARRSQAAVVQTLGPLLNSVYRVAGFRTADVSGRFRTTDFALTGRYKSRTVPKNVANVCKLTRMCASFGDIHPNAAGHALIAKTFGPLIDANVQPG